MYGTETFNVVNIFVVHFICHVTPAAHPLIIK